MAECSDEDEIEQATGSALEMAKQAMKGKNPTKSMLLMRGYLGLGGVSAAAVLLQERICGDVVHACEYREDVTGELPVEVMVLLGE